MLDECDTIVHSRHDSRKNKNKNKNKKTCCCAH